jgi:hypothetical protein
MSGSRALSFDIAGKPVAVRLPDAGRDLAARAAGRYREFLSPGVMRGEGGAEPFGMELDVSPGPLPEGAHPEWVDNPALEADGDLSRMGIRGDGFELELDWERRTGRGRIPDALSHLDLAVRVALGVELLREGDTLLHAGAVVRDTWGLAFAGPSGAGKSTIVRLCRESGCRSLGDDLIAFRRHRLASRIHGSPFWQGENASAPGGGLFVLAQGDEPRVDWLHPSEAVAPVLAAGGAPVDLPEVQRAFFEAVSGIVRHVPAYRLTFRPDTSFWDAIDARPEFSFFRPGGARARLSS